MFDEHWGINAVSGKIVKTCENYKKEVLWVLVRPNKRIIVYCSSKSIDQIQKTLKAKL